MELQLHKRKISYQDIQNDVVEILEDNEKHPIKFAHAWLNKQAIFEIPTSGSTGKPKLIRVSREQMQYSAQMTGKALDLQKGDKALVCLSTAHIAGRMMMVRGFELGLKIQVVTTCANPLADLPQDIQFDFIALVPLQIKSILESSQKHLLNQCKAIIVGGAPIDYALQQMIETLEAPVYSTYGMTETVSHIALKRLNGKEKQEAFHTLPEVTISQDERKCLTIQSPVCNNEILCTNDLVEILSPNSFLWKGRIDNVINSGGIKIQLEKVEKEIAKAFYDLELSNRFLVGGIEDQRLGTKLVLLVEGQTNFDFNTFRKQLNLGKYELPKELIHLEKFIETATGKVNRKECLALAKPQ